MKRGRILSLFLSAVLLVSAIIPCLQLSVNADRSNAISEIKSAWNQLKYETMEAFKPSKNFDKDTEWSIPLEATTDAEKEAGFGSYKFKINKNNVDEGNEWFLVNPSKDNFFDVMPAEEIGDVYMNVSSNKEIKVKAGYHVYFSYVEGGSTKSTDKVVFGPETTIPADGTPVKLSALNGTENFSAAMEQFIQQDATLSTKSDVKVQRFINFRLSVTQSDFRNTDTELTVGMGFFTHSSDPAFPADLGDSDDLVAIIDAAEDVIADESYIAASKTALQTAVNNAWAVVKTDEQLLVKAMQSTWNELVKNQETILPFSAYNKTGLKPSEFSMLYNQTEYNSNGEVNRNYIKNDAGNPLNDAAHSGVVTPKVSTTDEDIANFGNSYIELRKKTTDVVGTDKDIPSITVGDAIVTADPFYNYRSDITSLAVKFYSTKAITLGLKVWYAPVAGGYTSFTNKNIEIPAGEVSVVDLKALINSNRGTPVGVIRGVGFYIAGIDGEVNDSDVLKIGSIVGNPYEVCPSSVSGDDVSLASIYNKASTLDLTNYLNNSAMARFQKLCKAAKIIIHNNMSQQFANKEELIKVTVNELWPSLVSKEFLDYMYFERYNSSGVASDGYTEVYIQDGKSDPNNLDASRVGVSDAANSGNTVLLSSSGEQQKYYGNKYVRLTTQKFESGTALNADNSNDIPYLDTKHSVVVTQNKQIPVSDLKELQVTVKSSMAMTIGYKVWFIVSTVKDDGTTSSRWVTRMEEATIKANTYTTIDLMPSVESKQAELNKSAKDCTETIISIPYIGIGIKSMAETPGSNSYLEVGDIFTKFGAEVPEELKDNPTAIQLYDAMKKLNMDEYVDGEAKDNFIYAMDFAKDFSDLEWEAIYNDQDQLASVIKNQLWPKLVGKLTFKKRFYHYNSTGKNPDGFDYQYNLPVSEDSPAGTDTASSGNYWGTWGKPEIYGERYYKLTTQKTNPDTTIVIDNDIPYLDEKVCIITIGNNEYADSSIDVPNTDGIYVYMDSSMKMTINMGIWYMRADNEKGWGVTKFSFNIEAGLNKINIKEHLIKNQVVSNIKYINYVVVNPSGFEHAVTDDDYLEVGSIGSEDYAVVPRKLDTITSLSAIVREAQLLDMDDYIDNSDKDMFQNALERAVNLLNGLNVNLVEHAPVEAYVTDASGKRTKVSEKEFGYDEQARLYDGVTDKDPVVFNVKNKQLDVIFNLNDKMSLHEIRVYLQENNVKELEIYTAPVREAIWDASGLVYRYDGTTPGALNLGKAFTTPIENQYVRFSFKAVEGDTLKVTEFACIGKGIQQLAYSNVIEGKEDIMSFANYNYETGRAQFIRFEDGKFVDSLKNFKGQNVAHDGYLDTVVDFVGGSRTKNISYNLVFNLNGVCAIDNIKYYAASNPEYFPRHMKFYLGNDQMNIMDNNNEGTVCVAEFNEATTDENGLYNAKFLAQNAAYVRIEFILDGSVSDDGCYGDSFLLATKDIQIRGLSLNTSKGNAVKSFVDEETGIIVDILKLTEGDVYETAQSMKLAKRKPTADEIEQAGEFEFIFRDWIYTVTFLDYRGDTITDIGGREVYVSVPVADDEDLEMTFMATLYDGAVSLMEHDLLDIDDKYYVGILFDDPIGIVFAKGTIDDSYFEEEEPQEEEPQEEEPQEEEPQEEEPQEEEPVIDDDDFYDDEDYDDYDDEDYGDEEDEEPEEDDEETSNGKKKYLKVIKKSNGGLSTGAIVGIALGSVVVTAGGALLIIFRKKIFIPHKRTPKI